MVKQAQPPAPSGPNLSQTLDIVAKDAGYLADIGPRLYRGFLARGLLIRPLGNTIYLMPPYCSTADDLDLAYNAIDDLAAEFA